jgi:hypothetical protein
MIYYNQSFAVTGLGVPFNASSIALITSQSRLSSSLGATTWTHNGVPT